MIKNLATKRYIYTEANSQRNTEQRVIISINSHKKRYKVYNIISVKMVSKNNVNFQNNS